MGAVTRENDRMVPVGANSQVSMQVLQDIYNDITGKSERLTQTITDSYMVGIEDLVQLNSKIRQMYEQYHIVSENCSVTIYHSNDSKERFSSFSRFSLYDGSSLNPVENISIEYDFLIILPKLEKPQPYKIELNINSRVGLAQRNKRRPNFGGGFFHFIPSQNAVYEIDYVDYTVARNFQTAIDQWFSALESSKISSVMIFFKKVSEYYPLIFKNLTALFIAFSLYMSAEAWFKVNGEGGASLFALGLLSFSSIYIGSNIAMKLGSLTQRWIDMYNSLSYVKLNRGDEVAIREFRSDERVKLVKVSASVVLAVGLNLVSSWVAKFLGL